MPWFLRVLRYLASGRSSVSSSPAPAVPAYLQPAVRPARGLFRSVHARGGWRRVGAWQFRSDGCFRRRALTVGLVLLLVLALVWPMASPAQASPFQYARTLASLNASVDFEVRTTGSDSNGGGFKNGASGTDRSQQDAAHATLTTASTVHTTTTQLNVSVGNYTVTSADIGNLFQLTSGTATAGFYEITAVDVPNNRWTVDRALGTSGQTCAGAMGGALASIGKAGSAMAVSNQRVFIKSGTYTVTSATANVAGGVFSNSTTNVYIEGYGSTRGDMGTKPLFQASGIGTFAMFTVTNDRSIISNVSIDCASLTSSKGLSLRGFAYRVKAANCTNGGIVLANGSHVADCEATGCSTQPAFMASFAAALIDCKAYDNTVTGFSLSSNIITCTRCEADSNSGASSDGFSISGNPNISLINCLAYNSGRDGIRATDHVLLENCILESNGAWGVNLNSTNCVMSRLRCCAFYNNTSGAITVGSIRGIVEDGSISGSGSFFTDAPNRDFSLNNTAGAGALLRGLGYPAYVDVGAYQHADPVGGGGATFFVPVE